MFDFMKIMIYLAWVANSMVIFSASYIYDFDKQNKNFKNHDF